MPPRTRPLTSTTHVISARDYDLAATLDSGQAFRWEKCGETWEGVIGERVVRLVGDGDTIHATTATPQADWNWLEEYLQSGVDLDEIIATFPDDQPLKKATVACHGLRLLKQDPWECLASFILSSNKQIAHIKQIVSKLCVRFGTELECVPPRKPLRSFPSAERIASLAEKELRACGMGYRAPYLVESARMIVDGRISLAELPKMTLTQAREAITALPGVGPKIANCVLLFTGSHPGAFPVDVWIRKALLSFYFPNRARSQKQLEQFAGEYFGPFAGYAQQYLFHYARVRERARIVS